MAYKLPSWKHQDFTPGIDLYVAVKNIKEQWTNYKNASSTETIGKLDGYKTYAYNHIDIIAQRVVIIPEQQVIIKLRADFEDFEVDPEYLKVYESIKFSSINQVEEESIDYSNSNIGFQYPADWTIEEEYVANCLGLTSPQRAVENEKFLQKRRDPNFATDAYFPYDLTICQYAANDLSLDEWIGANVRESEILSRVELTIGGQPAVQLVIDNMGTPRVTYVKANDKVFVVSYTNADRDNGFTTMTILEGIRDSIYFK